MTPIRTKYDQTKVKDTPLFKEPASTQEIFSIKGIDESGIFELPGKKFSKLYTLSDINFSGITDAEQKSIIVNFSKVLKSISCRFSYTVANEYVDEKEFNEKILYRMRGDGFDDLRKNYNQVIRDKVTSARQGLYQTIYLTLTNTAEDMADAKAMFFSMEGAIRNAFIGMGVNGMQGSIMKAVPINERMQLIYNLTHRNENGGYKFDIKKEFAEHHDWSNIIAPASMRFENEIFTINDRYGTVLYIDEYPKSLESDILSSLSKINCTSYVTVNNELLDIAGFKQEIARKYMALGMKIENEKQRNRNNKDFLADASEKLLTEKKKLDDFSKEIDSLDDHYFNTTIMVMFIAKTKEELEQTLEKVKNVATLKSLKLKACFAKQREGFNSVMPFGIQEFKRVTNLSSSCLAMFIPFKTQELCDEDGSYYGINQLSRNAIFANKKKLKNHNGLIFGQSGSGKSMFTKSDIISTFVNNPDDEIIIIDPQSEYRNLCRITKGSILSFDSNSENYINPMDVDFRGVDYSKLREIIARKSDFILTLLANCMKRNLDAEEQGIVDSVVERVYMENYSLRKRLNGDSSKSSDYEIPDYIRVKDSLLSLDTNLSEEEQVRAYSPILQDVYQGLIDSDKIKGKQLAASMEIFVNGSLNLFNHRTNVDLSNRFVVFDISGLKDNLRVAAMLIMMELVREKIHKNSVSGKWTHLYIDEFHELLAVERVASFVLKLWKEIRKLRGVLNGITQNITELLNGDNSSKLSEILSNTEYFALLSQSTIDKEKLMKFLPDVSPAMFNFVDNAQAGTGLIKMGPVTVPFDLRMSSESEIYKIINTDGGNFGV